MRRAEASRALLQALGVACELTGTELTKDAARVMAADLARYPEGQVLGALDRCRRELRGRLTVAAVLERLDDGRPGPEEAWAMVPKGGNDCTAGHYSTAGAARRWVPEESATVVWTEEMRAAAGVAEPLIRLGDLVAARVAFAEAYRAACQRSRDAGLPVRWEVSLGTDKAGRELALLDACEKGRISSATVQALLPYHREDEGLSARVLALAAKSVKALPGAASA